VEIQLKKTKGKKKFPKDALVRYSICAIILIAIFLYFSKTLNLFFVQDDFWFLAAARKTITARLAFRGVLPDYFRPISTYWFHLFNTAFWGLNPWGHHFSQILAFLATCFFLFEYLYSVTKSILASALAMAIYGLSKTHVWTLGWISGDIDVLCALFMVATLWFTERYLAQNRPLWPVGVTLSLALLSKESSVILPVALGASLLFRNNGVDTAGFIKKRNRLFILIGGLLAIYLVFWKLATQAARSENPFALNLDRALYILQSSIFAIWPMAKQFPTGIHAGWLLLPAFALVILFLVRKEIKNFTSSAILVMALWLLPAALFMVVKTPADLQPYYAHFSILGLSLLVGLLFAALLKICESKEIGRTSNIITAILLFFYIIGSGNNVVALIKGSVVPSIYESHFSYAAYMQIKTATANHQYREIVIENMQDMMWWASGNGAMFQVMFPGIEINVDGRKEFVATPNMRTTNDVLVLTQATPVEFRIVR
jgi:hypothetical protein